MYAGLTREFIRRIPKTDLHVHLDGSLRLASLVEMARAAKVALPSFDEENLRARVFKEAYANLGEYLKGFAYTVAALQTADHLERAAYELVEDNLAEGVRYLEIRFAPQLHLHDGLDMRGVLGAVCRGIERARRRHADRPEVRAGADLPLYAGVIVCAMRCFTPGMSPYYRQLSAAMASAPRKEVYAAASLELARAAVAIRDAEGWPIVGFDLAGEEAGYPAGDHHAAYAYAHRHFLKKTVHAGEAYGPESIFQAITDCYANRIGHGTFLFAHDQIRSPEVADPAGYTAALADYIAQERVSLEVCLTSNLQTTPAIRAPSEHPVRRMIARELAVTICTDNRLVSNTTVCRELEQVAEHIPVTRHQFRNLILAGFKGSFFPGTYTEKRAYVRQVIDLYERLEREVLPAEPGPGGHGR